MTDFLLPVKSPIDRILIINAAIVMIVSFLIIRLLIISALIVSLLTYLTHYKTIKKECQQKKYKLFIM